MSTSITTENSACIDYLSGAMTGTVRVGGVGGVTVQVHRRFWLDHDIDGSWGVFVETGDSPVSTLDTPTGVIHATDPAVCAFIDQLAALFAAPDAFVEA